MSQSDAHDDDHVEGGYHATLQGYVKGFLLAVVLTAVPFALVMLKVPLSPRVLGLIILAFGAVQMIVHVVYFLHLDTAIEGGWTALATIFTVCLVVIMLAGSGWVMYHMNANMMPQLDSKTLHDMP